MDKTELETLAAEIHDKIAQFLQLESGVSGATVPEGRKDQVDILGDFIMAEVPGEPSLSEGAGDCAIRIIRSLQFDVKCLKSKCEQGACSTPCRDCGEQYAFEAIEQGKD